MFNQTLVDRAITTWPQWGVGLGCPPKILSELPGGQTNRSFVLDGGHRRLVLRVNHPDSERFGINRRHEYLILQATSKAGISPPLCYCSPEAGLLVTEYREGTHWQPGDMENRSKRDALLDLMHRIHQLQPDLPSFDYAAYARAYWLRLQDCGRPIPRELQKLYGLIEPLLDELFESLSATALCHHDPSPLNLIVSDRRLYLGDWEYAGNGHPLFDQIALQQLWNLPALSLFGEQLDRDVIELGQLVFRFYDQAWYQLRQAGKAGLAEGSGL